MDIESTAFDGRRDARENRTAEDIDVRARSRTVR